MRHIAIALTLVALAVPAMAQEPSAVDKMMAMYEEMARPVGEHKRLTDLEGKWKVTTRLWFDPAGQPTTATGTGTFESILGGRFVQSKFEVEGQLASESLSILGFDRRTNEYTMVGFDTLGTYYITAAGKWNEAQKAIVMHGSYLQPPANTEQKYRFVWTFQGRHEHVMTLYFSTGTSEVRVAETKMTRMR